MEQPGIKNQVNENEKFSGLKVPLLYGYDFTKCEFINCDLTSSRLSACVFEDCKFTSCNLGNTIFYQVQFSDCVFQKCKLIGVDWSGVNTAMGLKIKFEDCDLSYSSFSNIDMSGAEFERCKFPDTDFMNSKSPEVKYSECDFLRTRFKGMDFTGSDFCGSINYVIDPRDNKLKKAKFSKEEAVNILSVFGIIIK